MFRVLLFAGTTEGRKIAAFLAGAENVESLVYTATEYGGKLISEEDPRNRLSIRGRRVSGEEMEGLMKEFRPDLAIDATHPYAQVVTENLRRACETAGVSYLRVLRENGLRSGRAAFVEVDSVAAAVEFLRDKPGNVLAATGSKELPLFTSLPDYVQRVYPRILPLAGAVERCLDLGFPAGHLICMQGPFSEEMNVATLRQIQAQFLVTKDSGEVGGFSAKLRAAEQAGAQVVVVGRPPQTEGLAFSRLEEYLEQQYGLRSQVPLSGTEPALPPRQEERFNEERNTGTDPQMFPFFVRIKERPVTVIGAGRIAARRIGTLLKFSPRLTVIAPNPCETVAAWADEGRVVLLKREYSEGDCRGADFVLGITDSREVNHRVFEECRSLGIPVNLADCPEECSFYFPGVVTEGPLIVGITAGGTNHQKAAEAVGIIGAALKESGGQNL